MDPSITVAIIGAAIAIITPLVTVIANKISNHTGKLVKRLDEIDDKIDRNEAKRARTQILRFADEIYEDRHGKSKEHFQEIFDSITLYNNYCREHPDFQNDRTVMAQSTIKKVYDCCEADHSFLGDKNIVKEETK